MPFYPSSPKRNRFEFESDQGSDVSPAVSPQTRPASSMGDFNINHEHPPNSSVQQNIVYGHDRALDSVQEFHTAHSQHDDNAESGRDEDVPESKEATLEPHAISYEGPQDPNLKHRKEADAVEKSVESRSYTENGSASVVLGHEQIVEDARSQAGPTFYQRYRIFFHLIIWLFFTGFV